MTLVTTASPTPDERTWGMFCHLSSLSGHFFPFGNVIGPLVIWQLKRETMPFVNEEGKEALNFQISMTIYILVSIVLMFFCVGVFMLIGLGIFNLVMVIMACIETSNGKPFRYPMCIRFIA